MAKTFLLHSFLRSVTIYVLESPQTNISKYLSATTIPAWFIECPNFYQPISPRFIVESRNKTVLFFYIGNICNEYAWTRYIWIICYI